MQAFLHRGLYRRSCGPTVGVMIYLFMLFVGMPMLELYLLVRLSGMLGFGTALLIVVGTGMLGAWLARQQGLQVVTGIQQELAAGRMPAGRMLDGVLILLAGAVLITPGLITDIIGFALLLPPVRALVRTWLGVKLEQKLRDGSAQVNVWRM